MASKKSKRGIALEHILASLVGHPGRPQEQENPMPMTPTAHEKAEWARFAQAAYGAGLTWLGHRYSAAAALPVGATMATGAFDFMQRVYRAWLVSGLDAAKDEIMAEA
jgi:hypothetical protein